MDGPGVDHGAPRVGGRVIVIPLTYLIEIGLLWLLVYECVRARPTDDGSRAAGQAMLDRARERHYASQVKGT